MPEEINEVVETVEDVKEISLVKLLVFGAGAIALGFAAFKGGKYLKNRFEAKAEELNQDGTDADHDKTADKEVTEDEKTEK